MQVGRLFTCGCLVINLKLLELLESQKSSFSIFWILKVLKEQRTIKQQKAKCRISHKRSSLEKGIHKNFANFTGKHLCLSFTCEFCEIFKITSG